MRGLTICVIVGIVGTGILYIASRLAWHRSDPLTTIERLRNLQKVKR